MKVQSWTLPNPLEAIASFFSSVSKSMQLSRQIAANEQIARVLLVEYPEHTYYSLLAELNQRAMERFSKNV
jgi:hypothetical protein